MSSPAGDSTNLSSHSTSNAPRSAARRFSSLGGDQHERKRTKEAQWFNAIGHEDSKSSSSSTSKLKKDVYSKSRTGRHASVTNMPSSSFNSKSTTSQPSRSRRISDTTISERVDDYGLAARRPSQTPEQNFSSSGRSNPSRYDGAENLEAQGARKPLVEPQASKARYHGTSPSVLYVASASTRLTNRSDGSDSTVTKHSSDENIHKNVHESKASEDTVPVSSDRLHASVSDDTAVSEDEMDKTEMLSDTESSSSHSLASELSSSKSPETQSSRSTAPSPPSRHTPNHTPRWPESQPRWPPYRSQTPVNGLERPNENEQAEAHHRTWNMEQQFHPFQFHEEAYSSHPNQPQQQYSKQPHETSSHVPEAGFSGHHQPIYFQAKAIESVATTGQDQSAHVFPHVKHGIPKAPEAPNLDRTTLAGYELLATKLAEAPPTIRPTYRKFEKLHHRILLHIQDELCELEEHLRKFDEISAQMSIRDEAGGCLPASRRAEVYYGDELHLNRTHLLGQIFVKLEQYHRALSAYSSVTKGFDCPDEHDVERYRAWMAANHPIHQTEADFLRDSKDLVAVPQRAIARRFPMVLLAFLPFSPLVTFSLVPTFSGRVFLTGVILAMSWSYISGTDSRLSLSDRDWAVSIVVYLSLTTMVACIVG